MQDLSELCSEPFAHAQRVNMFKISWKLSPKRPDFLEKMGRLQGNLMLFFHVDNSEMSTAGHLERPPTHPNLGGVIQGDPWPGRIAH